VLPAITHTFYTRKSRAEPSRAEPSRAEPSRAEPSHTRNLQLQSATVASLFTDFERMVACVKLVRSRTAVLCTKMHACRESQRLTTQPTVLVRLITTKCKRFGSICSQPFHVRYFVTNMLYNHIKTLHDVKIVHN